MSVTIEPANSVVLIVGREQFTVPPTFNGATSVGTLDCVALAVRSVDDGPTVVTVVPEGAPAGMLLVGTYELESEGLLSVRDVYGREFLAVGVDPGVCGLEIWGNDASDPDRVTLVVRSG